MRRCEKRCEDEKMWRWEDVKMRRCEDEQMWRWADVKMRRCERRCEDEKMWRGADVREGVNMRRCEDEKVWRWEGVREGVKMRRCEDEKMRYRPPLLEEPCAQTLSGIKKVLNPLGTRFFGPSLAHWIPMHQKKTPLVMTFTVRHGKSQP